MINRLIHRCINGVLCGLEIGIPRLIRINLFTVSFTKRTMNDQLHRLLRPKELVGRQQVIGRSSIVPAEPGVYAWYFSKSPSNEIRLDDCWKWQERHLLYIGISPEEPPKNGKPPSSQNLRKRIAYHMRGNAYSSTLRLSVGCLLSRSLRIQLQRVGTGTRMTFSVGEDILSNWLEENVSVTWVTHHEPWLLEAEAISSLYLPLNIDQNASHPFHSTLSAIRKEAKAVAKSLPIRPK
jgi:hypothetical protein